jgi:hypothetical protein
MESPFRVTVFGKDFSVKGILGNPLSQSYTVRFNAVGTGEFEVSATDPMLQFLYESGARVRVTYKGAHLMSGPVLHPSGDFNADGVVRFQVEDDYRILVNTLAFVEPESPLTRTEVNFNLQVVVTNPGYYRWTSSSPDNDAFFVSDAEFAIKRIISRNVVSRLQRPVTVAPNLSRGVGAQMGPLVRFDPIAEAVAPILQWSGLALRLSHNGVTPTITADVSVPTVHPQILTVQSGIIQDGKWGKQNPTTTRVVVGGQGEVLNRLFWGVTALPVEVEYGDIVEVFRDSTNNIMRWPDGTAETSKIPEGFFVPGASSVAFQDEAAAYLTNAANKGLAEGAPKASLSLTLSETETFFYGPGGYREGDIITAQSNGVNFTDRITECELSESVTAGVIVRPRVGDRADDPDTIFADAINRLARAQRRLSTDK